MTYAGGSTRFNVSDGTVSNVKPEFGAVTLERLDVGYCHLEANGGWNKGTLTFMVRPSGVPLVGINTNISPSQPYSLDGDYATLPEDGSANHWLCVQATVRYVGKSQDVFSYAHALDAPNSVLN